MRIMTETQKVECHDSWGNARNPIRRDIKRLTLCLNTKRCSTKGLNALLRH
jgi:hypothetical protein